MPLGPSLHLNKTSGCMVCAACLANRLCWVLLAAGSTGEGSGRPPGPAPLLPRIAGAVEGGEQLRRSTRTCRAAPAPSAGGRGLGAMLVGDAGALGRRFSGALPHQSITVLDACSGCAGRAGLHRV